MLEQNTNKFLVLNGSKGWYESRMKMINLLLVSSCTNLSKNHQALLTSSLDHSTIYIDGDEIKSWSVYLAHNHDMQDMSFECKSISNDGMQRLWQDLAWYLMMALDFIRYYQNNNNNNNNNNNSLIK